MSGYGLTYKPIICNPQIYASEFVAIFTFMDFFTYFFSLSLEFVSLRKKYDSRILLLLNIYKLSYLIS